jgi:16S rRNA (adenine1518-N6/adenine1519-N6)-dimethyltransferase
MSSPAHRFPHVARKRFGQHFLADRGIIDAIVDAINPRPGDAMVEIGPGLAALTQPLVERLGALTVIELDRDLAVRLREHPQLTVIESDVLKVDFRQLAYGFLALKNSAHNGTDTKAAISATTSATPATPTTVAPKLRVVGNLPYNISTPILFHLLDCADGIVDQHFMLQKEVIDRMVASPSCSDYGRLSVMLQWRYAMENVLFVPPESFDPPPRVDTVKVAFSQRRKLLRHSLGKWLDEQQFTGHFDLHRRAEEVPPHEYVALAQAL